VPIINYRIWTTPVYQVLALRSNFPRAGERSLGKGWASASEETEARGQAEAVVVAVS